MTATETPAAAPTRRNRPGAFIAQERLVDNTPTKLDALIVENEALQAQIDAAQSPSELERLAREEYGMVRPGETGYVVELDGGPVPQAVINQNEEIDSRSLLERFWDFLTGRDLVPDE